MILECEKFKRPDGKIVTKIRYCGKLLGFTMLSRTPIARDKLLTGHILKNRWDAGDREESVLFRKRSYKAKGSDQDTFDYKDGCTDEAWEALRSGSNQDLLKLDNLRA